MPDAGMRARRSCTCSHPSSSERAAVRVTDDLGCAGGARSRRLEARDGRLDKGAAQGARQASGPGSGSSCSGACRALCCGRQGGGQRRAAAAAAAASTGSGGSEPLCRHRAHAAHRGRSTRSHGRQSFRGHQPRRPQQHHAGKRRAQAALQWMAWECSGLSWHRRLVFRVRRAVPCCAAQTRCTSQAGEGDKGGAPTNGSSKADAAAPTDAKPKVRAAPLGDVAHKSRCAWGDTAAACPRPQAQDDAAAAGVAEQAPTTTAPASAGGFGALAAGAGGGGGGSNPFASLGAKPFGGFGSTGGGFGALGAAAAAGGGGFGGFGAAGGGAGAGECRSPSRRVVVGEPLVPALVLRSAAPAIQAGRCSLWCSSQAQRARAVLRCWAGRRRRLQAARAGLAAAAPFPLARARSRRWRRRRWRARRRVARPAARAARRRRAARAAATRAWRCLATRWCSRW